MQYSTSPKDGLPLIAHTATCVTIGNFDGVHAGHQALLRRTVQKAQQHALAAVAVTFWPHPLAVLASSHAPALLMSREKRLHCFAEQGLDMTLELAFSRDMAALSPETFVQEVLVPLQCRQLIIGYDFSLGKARAGNVAVLQQLGEVYGFQVEQLSPVIMHDAVVSSTRIRNLIRAGEVWDAQALLGRYYEIQGDVVHGHGRGTGLGFPTANVHTEHALLPREGVYATWAYTAHVDAPRYPSVTNIGYVPTFGNDTLSIESFLLEGSPELYGEELSLAFVQRIRGEECFPHVDALKERIGKDVLLARDILGEK